MRDRWHSILLGGVIALLCAGTVVLIVLAFQSHARYEKACEALGGRVQSDTTYGYGYTSDGKYVQTSSTETYCVSPDGRLLFP